jgi:hypothetical protein
MSTNTILASAPLTTTNYVLKANGTTLGNSLIFDNGTNVGIGNTNTSYTLDVSGTGRFTGALTGTSATFSGALTINLSSSASAINLINTSTNNIFTTYSNASNNTYIGLVGNNGVVQTNNDFEVYTGASYTKRLTITSAGNVGIGTSSPNLTNINRTVLDINGTSTSLLGLSVGGTAKSYLFQNGNDLFINSIAGIMAFTVETANYMSFSTNNTERMRITSYGSVCFGVTNSPGSNPAYKAAFTDAIAMSVSANGNNMVNFFNGSGTYVASIAVAASSVAYNTTSDYRLKQDLKDFGGLDLLSNIKVYDFAWKLDNTRTYGVVAHELADVLPSAVSGEKDGENIQGVDYSKLVPVLVKAIQEQQALITSLQARLETLENK